MDDWARVYAGSPDQLLLALSREAETLKPEARDALAAEICKRGIVPGGAASDFPDEHREPPVSRPDRRPLGILGGTNVIVLSLLLIEACVVSVESLFEKEWLRNTVIAIGISLVPATFLVARNAVSLSLRILSASYSGAAACLLVWHVVTMDVTEMHPIAFAIGDQICSVLFALLAIVNALCLLSDGYAPPRGPGDS